MSEGLFSGYIKLKEDINKDIVRQNEGIVRPEFSEVAVRCFLLFSEYLSRAAFAPTPKNKELMKLIDLDNSVIAERMGITESTVRAKKCVAAKEIARQLGDNVIDVIRSGNEFEIERLATKIRTLMLYRHPTDWLPEGIIEQYAGVYNGKAYDKVDVLSWQRTLIQDEEEYSKTFLHSVHSQLSAIFNYLCKYKDLPHNPASECGSMGQKKVDEMEFWTVDEFNTFIPVVDDVMFRTIFYVLFFSGMRVGELLALTKEDIDFDCNTISISKTFNRVGGKDIITSPKTRKSKRVIDMHPTIMKILQDYVDALYELRDNDRLFATTKSGIAKRKAAYCKQSGVKQIRTHDLRHSHVAMLINLGVRIEVISARLGHEKVSTTWDIYGHLYPNSQQEAVAKMDACIKI